MPNTGVLVFVEPMAKAQKGVILNFSSESALRPLTRVCGYGTAKAAIFNYTQYMATELASKYIPNIRVNAITPGFLLTDSRSFVSYTRHEYFRRLLCQILGADYDAGLIPQSELPRLEQMTADICHHNAARYFGF